MHSLKSVWCCSKTHLGVLLEKSVLFAFLRLGGFTCHNKLSFYWKHGYALQLSWSPWHQDSCQLGRHIAIVIFCCSHTEHNLGFEYLTNSTYTYSKAHVLVSWTTQGLDDAFKFFLPWVHMNSLTTSAMFRMLSVVLTMVNIMGIVQGWVWNISYQIPTFVSSNHICSSSPHKPSPP